MTGLSEALLRKRMAHGEQILLANMIPFIERRIKMAQEHGAKEINSAAQELREAEAALRSALDRLLAAEKEVSEKAKASVSRAKDSAAQMVDQLARVNKILGTDFSVRLEQIERLADSLSRLEVLAKEGSLNTILSALTPK